MRTKNILLATKDRQIFIEQFWVKDKIYHNVFQKRCTKLVVVVFIWNESDFMTISGSSFIGTSVGRRNVG